MTVVEAVAKLEAAADIAAKTGCELAKLPAKDAWEIADLLKKLVIASNGSDHDRGYYFGDSSGYYYLQDETC